MAALQEDTEKENANMNNCLAVSMKMLNESCLKTMEMQARLQGVELSGRGKHIGDVYQTDIAEMDTKTKSIIDKLRHLSVNGRATQAMGQTTQVINDAAAQINDIKDLGKAVRTITKGFGEMGAASTAGP